MRILINNTDYNILIQLQSNVSITGSYVDAKQGAIDKLESLLTKQLNNAISSTSSTILSRFNQSALQNVASANVALSAGTNAVVSTGVNAVVNTAALMAATSPVNAISSLATTRRIVNFSKNIFANQAMDQVNVLPSSMLSVVNNIVVIPPKDTYEYIQNYFNTSSFYYVTGYTNSKYNDLVKSFVDYGNHVATISQKVGSYQAVSANRAERSSLANVTELSKTVNRSVVPSTVSGIGVNTKVLPATLGAAPALNVSSAAINLGSYEADVKPIMDDSYKTHKKILIHGTDIYGMILNIGTYKEYVLYVGGDYPIKYIDFPDGATKFMYRRSSDIESNKANIILYPGLIEEPKILNEVFIDRGVNNAFEPVKRLKNVSTLNELIKTGLGYYKMNTKGFNFKNAQ